MTGEAESVGGLARGINFGNALDAPAEAEPVFRIRERYFDDVAEAGFDTVRLPVRWSAHAAAAEPYAVDPGFFERVDWAVTNALARDLSVVVNVHHYDQLCDAPQQHAARFVALWRQIARRYAGQPPRLLFELLNEPREPMTAEDWNALLAEALGVVRESNPDRIVIVGPVGANHVNALPTLALPEDDRLMVTIHYYSPFEFTHQGAEWVEGAERWVGATWGDGDRAVVRSDLARAAAWAGEHQRPLFLGEFGVYGKADMGSRSKWTAFVRSEAERLGMSWAYWDFGTDFGAFDTARNTWRGPLKRALVGE